MLTAPHIVGRFLLATWRRNYPLERFSCWSVPHQFPFCLLVSKGRPSSKLPRIFSFYLRDFPQEILRTSSCEWRGIVPVKVPEEITPPFPLHISPSITFKNAMKPLPSDICSSSCNGFILSRRKEGGFRQGCVRYAPVVAFHPCLFPMGNFSVHEQVQGDLHQKNP